MDKQIQYERGVLLVYIIIIVFLFSILMLPVVTIVSGKIKILRSSADREQALQIAEAGVNHNGSLENARRLVDIAAESGADAVKFQTFRADRLVTPGAPKATYQSCRTDSDESQHAMLKKLELTLLGQMI